MTPPEILEVERPNSETVMLSLGVPIGHPAFDGHFVLEPILPGVVQIDWVTRLAAYHFDIERFAATDFQVKFRSIIRPGPDLRLTLRLDRMSGSLSFEYHSMGVAASSGRIRLGRSP